METNQQTKKSDFILNPSTQLMLMDKWDQTDPIRDASDPSLLNSYHAEIPQCSRVDLNVFLFFF